MKARGFTLIELMIVIAIIGVLLAIVFSAFENVENNTNEGEYMNDISLENVERTYIDDNRRSSEPVILRKHTDDSLWVCIENGRCYEIVK